MCIWYLTVMSSARWRPVDLWTGQSLKVAGFAQHPYPYNIIASCSAAFISDIQWTLEVVITTCTTDLLSYIAFMTHALQVSRQPKQLTASKPYAKDSCRGVSWVPEVESARRRLVSEEGSPTSRFPLAQPYVRVREVLLEVSCHPIAWPWIAENAASVNRGWDLSGGLPRRSNTSQGTCNLETRHCLWAKAQKVSLQQPLYL